LSPGGAHRGTANATTYGSPGTYSPARRYRIQLDKITDRPARRRSAAGAPSSGYHSDELRRSGVRERTAIELLGEASPGGRLRRSA